MKKVLILAYDFPPYVSVGGLRPYTWFKYLKDFDVEPIVVTRAWSNFYGNGLDYISPSTIHKREYDYTSEGLIIRTPYFPTLSNKLLLKYGDTKFRLLRKINTAWFEFTQFLFVNGPRKELFKAADEYLRNHKVDLIIATGEPFVTFYYASKLSVKYNIKWVADYRDPWSQKKVFKKLKGFYEWNKFMESKIVPTASVITTVSDAVTETMLEPIRKKDIYLINNGFDPEAMEKVMNVCQKQTVLTISLAGSIYQWHPWQSFLNQIEKVCKETGFLINVKFYGVNIPEEIIAYVKEKSEFLQSAVTIFPKLSNEDLLVELANDNILLLFNDYTIHGTKVFDYVGLRRKILLCYSNDKDALELREQFFNVGTGSLEEQQLQREVVESTNSGIIVENEKHLNVVLLDMLNEFQQNGFIACHSTGVEKYSRKIQVKRLAELIHEITDKKK